MAVKDKNKKQNQLPKKKPVVFGDIVNFPMKLIEPIANLLQGEAKKLEVKKKELVKSDPFSDQNRLDDNASIDIEAAEQIGHETTTALKSQVDRRLIQIRQALSRIKIGKYGICEKCGQMIDTDRLMVMPEATLCVKCSKSRSSS